MGARAFALQAIAVLGACGGGGGSTDVKPTLSFADRTDLEISRLVSAAAGSEGFQAEGQIFRFDDPIDPDPCPNVIEDASANHVSVSGGCTMADGTAVEGSADLTNPAGWGNLDYDFRSDSVYSFSQLAIVSSGFRTSYDGIVDIGPSYQHLDMNLTSELLGVVVLTDVYMECSGSGCEIMNSGVELVGVGGALVSGKIGVTGQATEGNLTLRGVDTVKVTITSNCVAWRLEGTDRAHTCP
jgi:hypothetical protein